MKPNRIALMFLLTLIMVLQSAVMSLTAFAEGTNQPNVIEYGLYNYVDDNLISPTPYMGSVITTGPTPNGTYNQPPWPSLTNVPCVFENNMVVAIKFTTNVSTPTYYDANITKMHMYDIFNNEVAINVKRSGDGTNKDINRDYLFVTPQETLQPYSIYKIVIDSTITSNNGQQAGKTQEISLITRQTSKYANIIRFVGVNRVETAGTIAKYLFPDGAKTVIIAESRKMADSMIGTLLSGTLNAPMLLVDKQTDPNNYSILKGQIASLDPKTVYILGGSAVVSDDIYNYLQAEDYSVKRIAGADRFDTAVEIIKEAQRYVSIGETLYIANGRGQTDDNGLMLAAEGYSLAPSADVARNFNPVLLVDKNWTTADKAARVINLIDKAKLNSITNCVILGGINEVPTEIEEVLAAKLSSAIITRETGDVYTVSSKLALAYAKANNASDVVLALGDTFADALAGELLAAKKNAPLIFVKANSVPKPAYDAINAIVHGYSKAYILGSNAAINDNVADIVNELIANKKSK